MNLPMGGGGDDLEDNFDLDVGYDPKKETQVLTYAIDEGYKGITDEEDNGNESSPVYEDRYEELSEASDLESDLEQDFPKQELQIIKKSEAMEEVNGTSHELPAELPFTFDVPESHSKLMKWFNHRTLKDKALILHRIKACNHISLNGENKEKMQVIQGWKFTYF